MFLPSSKVSTLLIFFGLMTACSTDASVPQPTQKSVAVAEPTEVPTLVASPRPTVPPTERPLALPTEVPAETPTEVPTPLPTEPPPTQVETNAPPELSIACTLDDEQLKVSCQAYGTSSEPTRREWRYEDGTSGGQQFAFSLYEPIEPETWVTYEECINSSCTNVETLIDTSHLMSETMSTEGDDPVGTEEGGGLVGTLWAPRL